MANERHPACLADDSLGQPYRNDEDPTGLLNEGFRYRDLETGTFITRDPLGFVDGPNMYAYVVQNPWTHFDPEGLKKKQDYEKVIKTLSTKRAELTAKRDEAAEKGKSTRSIDKQIGNVDRAIQKNFEKIVKIEESARYVNEKIKRGEIDPGYSAIDAEQLDDESAAFGAIGGLMHTEKDIELLTYARNAAIAGAVASAGVATYEAGPAIGAILLSRFPTLASAMGLAGGGGVVVSQHALRHIANMSQAEQQAVQQAIQQDLIARGAPMVGQTIQRSVMVNGAQISYRAFSQEAGKVNVGTLVQGVFNRDVSK